MISLRNCSEGAIRYEIMKVVPLEKWARVATCHLDSGLLTARKGKSGASGSGTKEKQFREIGLMTTAKVAIQGHIWPHNFVK